MNGLFCSLQLKSDFKRRQEEDKYPQVPKPHLQHLRSAQPAVPAAAALLEAVCCAPRWPTERAEGDFWAFR